MNGTTEKKWYQRRNLGIITLKVLSVVILLGTAVATGCALGRR